MAEKDLIRIVQCVLGQNHNNSGVVITDWENAITVAKRNGIFQYLYRYMIQHCKDCKPQEPIVTYMEKLNALELRQGVRQEYIIDTLRKGFEEKGVDHIFIKGSVTKKRYPDPYLRSMGDIDFLYNPEQHDLLRSEMVKLGFKVKRIGRVHDLYVNDSNVVVEAHRQLVSSNSIYYSFGENIWNNSKKKNGSQHEYLMSDEDEFIFNFIHLASHFKKGGVGIRFIIDIWVYKHLPLNWDYINNELSSLNLSKFYHLIDLLSEKWFGNMSINNDIVDEIESYIFSGGVFGNKENRNNSAIRDGKIKYFFRVCFPNYAEMKSMFPWLNHKVILPFAWIYRVIESIIKRRDNVKSLLAPIKSSKRSSASELKCFYNKCGLE